MPLVGGGGLQGWLIEDPGGLRRHGQAELVDDEILVVGIGVVQRQFHAPAVWLAGGVGPDEDVVEVRDDFVIGGRAHMDGRHEVGGEAGGGGGFGGEVLRGTGGEESGETGIK
ncbi:MAG TPA: hypothetical protein VI703_05510 [Anaerolineales bacterium]|nr:hypothetical protein [Anaerolineales bacterium]